MTIEPIRKSVCVACPPARAFTLFTARMGRWWPARMTIAAAPFAEIVIEPRVGGLWFERSADGVESQWGHVMEWEPPDRVLLAWQIGEGFRFDPGLVTELEMRFEAEGEGCRVSLEHRHLERLGAVAESLAKLLAGGWPTIVGAYGAFADAAGVEV